MTTDTNALQERIERELEEMFDGGGFNARDMARDLTPLIAAEVRKARADAWDEGFEVGESNGYAIGRDIDTDENTESPYREQED